MNVRVRYTPGSLARVRKVVRKLNSEVVEAMDETSRNTAEQMVAIAKSLAPHRTGALIDSIQRTGPGQIVPAHAQGQSGRFKGPLREGQHVVTVGNDEVRYAHLVEFGAPKHIAGGMFKGAEHPGAPKQPFFWPAYRAVRSDHKKRSSKAVTKAIRKAKKG